MGIESISGIGQTSGAELKVNLSDKQAVNDAYSTLGSLLGGNGQQAQAAPAQAPAAPAAPKQDDGGGLGGIVKTVAPILGAVASIF